MTNAGYIKRLPANTYRSQRRGGKGISAMSTREEDYVDTLSLIHILYYLAGARSFRTRKDAELIRFGENTAYIRAACLSFSRELEPVSYTHLFSRPSRFGMLPPSKLPLSVTP